MDCIFCKIINNELPCFKIYEDEDVLAFLDIHPVSEGHTLVIPKKHFENIFEIDKDYLQKIIIVAKNIAQKVIQTNIGEGVNLFQSNGVVAEQVVPHFHLHIIPRRQGDSIDFTKKSFKPIDKPTDEQFENIRKTLTLV
jgi:histidine triad (HIT) family protein